MLVYLLCQNTNAEVCTHTFARTVHAFDPKISAQVLKDQVCLIKRRRTQHAALEEPL